MKKCGLKRNIDIKFLSLLDFCGSVRVSRFEPTLDLGDAGWCRLLLFVAHTTSAARVHWVSKYWCRLLTRAIHA